MAGRASNLCGDAQGRAAEVTPGGPEGAQDAGRERAGEGHEGGQWEMGSQCTVFLATYCVVLSRLVL